MDYCKTNDGILVSQNDFDIAQTLDCGQAFRWSSCGDGSFEGYFLNNRLKISETGKGTFLFHNVSEDEYLGIWKNYFDFDTDYGELKKRFSEDETLAKACEFASGIRILRQDPWETLCSFIISQNNNIPRIKGIIGRLCERYGGFPSALRLSEETADSLAYLRSGFRAKYIEDAAKKIASGEISTGAAAVLPLEDAKKELMKIKGVGPKVADCVLLFGMHRMDAYPVDVWIKRVLARFYPDGMPQCTKGFEGAAQQYLFHYVRCNPGELDDN
ncbi:MAG: hypothetical protein MJ052_05490 [Sphaerochaetaceae bacterium]|nr:hypothetical protein [Sphaerochaetaceae bacterium]